jgi:hypothetical protein
MRTIIRLAVALTVLAAALLGWRLGSAEATAGVAVRPRLVVFDADREQIKMARWAAWRFEIAQLDVPEVEVHFHDDPAGCYGYLGYAKGGRVDLCTTLVNVMSRRALLHEMGHIWLDEHIDASEQARFLELRGLRSWNSRDVPWNLRGYEHGAEVFAWALGERIITPSIPDNEPEKLELAFRMLSGRELPELPSRVA